MEDFGLSRIESVWKEEKKSKGLSELSEGFYEEVADYAAELKGEIHGSQGVRRELLEEELEQVLYMVQEIYLLRVLKIAGTLFHEEKEELIEEEKRTFDNIKEKLRNLREELIEPVVNSKMELKPPEEHSNIVVMILSDIPEPITASDLNFYGPFKEGEFANLPRKSAELLVEQGLARMIRITEAGN